MNGRLFLPLILIAALACMTGCTSTTREGAAGASEWSDSDTEDASGSAATPSSDTGEGDTDSGGQAEPDPARGEPFDPNAEDQLDGQQLEPPEPSDEALPDFSLADVNADSARYQELVSPRDYLGQLSAWYFGHST